MLLRFLIASILMIKGVIQVKILHKILNKELIKQLRDSILFYYRNCFLMNSNS